jgi:endonuclease YncB( thermonuclease family)
MRSLLIRTLLAALVTIAAILASPHRVEAIPASRVFLNGRPSPVFFNDGDSFRVLGGPLQGTKARLAGFNTLESHGPVHRWGTWTKKELYWNAKLATLNARRGVWHCVSKDMKRDTYGRILWWCKDLAVDQVRRGYAHAMSVNHNPGKKAIVAAMRDAIKHKRGMWAHGVPAYVLTSLHSASEGGGRDGRTYNRLVSTLDGHSAKWEHKDTYGKCDEICSKEREVKPATIDAALKLLLADAELKAGLDKLKAHQPRQIVADYARLGYFVGVKDSALETKLKAKLGQLKTEGKLGSGQPKMGSCGVHVDFRQRYGRGRAACLK